MNMGGEWMRRMGEGKPVHLALGDEENGGGQTSASCPWGREIPIQGEGELRLVQLSTNLGLG